MNVFKDIFFYIVVATVGLTILPDLSVYLPKPVSAIAIILLGGFLMGVKMYQTKQAYTDGKNGVVGSKYQ